VIWSTTILSVFAEATRRRLFDRAVFDKALLTGYHFPFPAVGTIVADGAGHTFVPAAYLRTTHTETAIVRPHRWPFSTHYFGQPKYCLSTIIGTEGRPVTV
jgi:hypothetical protein